MVCSIGRASGPDGVVRGNFDRFLVCIGRAAWSPGPEASPVVQAQADTNLCRHVSGVPLAVMARMASDREWFQSRCRGKVGLVAGIRSDEQLIAADHHQENREKATSDGGGATCPLPSEGRCMPPEICKTLVGGPVGTSRIAEQPDRRAPECLNG